MLLTHSPADIIRYLLIHAGGGVLPPSTNAWPIYAWQEPDLPDNVVTLYDTSGKMDGRIHDGEHQQHEGVQIRVRAAVASDGNTKIRGLVEILDKQILNTIVVCNNVSGSGTSTYKVISVTRPGTIMSIGKDTPTTKRAIFTCNLLVTVEQLS